jgi:hypothetical protein
MPIVEAQPFALFFSLVFRFLVIPWIQAELDEYWDFMNGYLPRRNSHKLTPHGRPEDIHFFPQDYGKTRDFKVTFTVTNYCHPCAHLFV